ncbi:3912_t:CDS:10 [Ambispora leptoticha]|uniref:3912_t:CDS:1 n=1 Tax=Ambispora leptoticha TaxID=144679 RepID=A0A9N9ASL5_9GLOM|nr:3912_t:CDS:10 [Ambispora leptoticha]
MSSDGGIEEGLREKQRRRKRETKTFRRLQLCLWGLCLTIAFLYALSEIWIVVTQRPVVKIKRALRDYIPMPNLDIAFNYRFNVTCQFKYMSIQPEGKDKYGKYNARMITYNFSTPNVPPLNFSRPDQRYGAHFTIVLDDDSYNATNDLGMFVTAVDTEFDPYTLPDNTRNTVEKLDPNFFASLNNTNKNIIGTFARNFMFIKREISKRVNPTWISYTGFPSQHVSIPYIVTSFESASIPGASKNVTANLLSRGSVYGDLLVGTLDWVVEERNEYRDKTKQTVTRDYGNSPAPFIEKADPNQAILDRINNFEAFLKKYVVKTDYIRSRKDIEDEEALLDQENQNGANGNSSSTSSPSTSSIHARRPTLQPDDQIQVQSQPQPNKTTNNPSTPQDPFADGSGSATQHGVADPQDSLSAKIKRKPVDNDNQKNAVPSSSDPSSKIIKIVPAAVRFGLTGKKRNSGSSEKSNKPSNETANQSPTSADDTIPSSTNIKKPSMTEDKPTSSDNGKTGGAQKTAAAIGAGLAGIWGVKNKNKKSNPVSFGDKPTSDDTSKNEKPTDEDKIVVSQNPTGPHAIKKDDKSGHSKQRAPTTIVPGKGISNEKADSIASSPIEERKQSVSSLTSSVLREEKYPDPDLITEHEKFVSDAEILFKETDSKRSSQSTTKAGVFDNVAGSTVVDQTFINTIISEAEETPRNSFLLDAQAAANAELYLQQQALGSSTDHLQVGTVSSNQLFTNSKRDIEVISIKSTSSHITEVVKVNTANIDSGGAAEYAEQVMKSYETQQKIRTSDAPSLPPLKNLEALIDRRDSTMTEFSQTSTRAASVQLSSPGFSYDDPRRESTLTNASTEVGDTLTKVIPQKRIDIIKYIDEDGNEIDPDELGDGSKFEIVEEKTTVEYIEQKVASSDSENEEWATPILLFNKNLGEEWKSVADEMKKKEEWRVRFLENTQSTPGDLTFPKSNVTFLCLSYKDWEPLNSDNQKQDLIQKLIKRIQLCNQRYRKVYLLIYLGYGNMQPLYEIQIRLLASYAMIKIFPVHNVQEIIDFISKILHPDIQPDIQQLAKWKEQSVNDPTNLIATNKWVHLVAQMSAGTEKLRLHECYVLQEGLQTIYNIATATESQLLDCSLDRETAQNIVKFFKEDYLA